MSLRNYANAPATTLSAGCTSTGTMLTAASDPGFPAAPFTLILDEGQATEEVALCVAKSGFTFTVTRGFDQSTTYAHTAGASLTHGISAIDPREANTHVNSTADVHGVTGALVGTTKAQTLSNKTLTAPQINGGVADSPWVTHANLTNASTIYPDPASQTVPVVIWNSSGVRVGQFDRDGILTAPEFISNPGNTFPGLIAHVGNGQTQSAVEVRKDNETPLAGFDANGNVFAQNLRPDNGTAALYWYGSKNDADHIANGTWQTLEVFHPDDVNGGIPWTYSNGQVTFPITGRYRMTASAGFGGGSAAGARGIRIYHTSNLGAGSEVIRSMVPTGATNPTALTVSVSKIQPANSTVCVQLFQSSGGTLDGGGLTNGPCLLQVEWIGPS